MRAEIELLFLDGLLDTNTIHDVLLRSIFDSNKTESELHILAFKHPLSISSLVHNINLSDNTNGPDTLWVELSGHLQAIRCGHICIGWQHAKNNSSMVTTVPCRHALSDFFDILILAIDGNTSDTRQVYHCQIGASVRVNVEYDGLVNDVLFLSTDLVRQKVNGVLDLLEVGELLVGYFFKLGPRLNQF